jgi:hypothetical protein
LIDFAKALAVNPPRTDWTGETALAVAKSLIGGTSHRLDWDEEAGEEWISLLGETGRVGIIAASRPLAVLTEGEDSLVTRATEHPFGVVLVPSFGDPVLVCDEAELRAAFGTGLDVMPFSATDLWFGTI